jgi:hypothetical protein
MPDATKTLTIADLTERLCLPAHEQGAVAAWTGEAYETLFTPGGGWMPVFDEDDIARLLLAWQIDSERIERDA